MITGGGGFIGANLTRKLLDRGYEVNLIWKSTTNPWRIEDIKNKIKLYEVDLLDQESLIKFLKKIKPKAIFHLAAHGAYPIQLDLNKMIDVAIKGTLNLLFASKNIDYDIFVNTGSSSEYGLKKRSMKEDDLLEPVTFYAATKASSTLLCQVFAKQYKKNVVTYRPFSVFGPYEEPTRFIPTIIRNAFSDKPIDLTESEIRHDFIYIDDVVDAYIASIKNKNNLRAKIINLGSGKQYSNMEVAKMILRLTKSNSKIRKQKYSNRSWDSGYWLANTKVSAELLGFKPNTNLSSGLLKTINWFKNSKLNTGLV